MFSGFKGLVEPSLFSVSYRALTDAIDEGFGRITYNKKDQAFVDQLRKSAAWFSARKTYRQQQELAALLTDENGKTRTWRQFQAASKAIVGDYNQTWLKVEYNTAIASARNAKLWKQYEADADQYPNLKYLPSRAATPREDHKPYYGVVRPINDDFWVQHYPPSAYNCQCSVEQSDDDETAMPTSGDKPVPGLDHNPGKTGELFSKSHPYSDTLTDEELKKIDREGERLANSIDDQQ